ncbi:MAG: glycosyltransferase family 4 protein [Planctomycetes bacterium]|nr:glycosyltransferase family 4 protein [Planctomycetota bacterium]
MRPPRVVMLLGNGFSPDPRVEAAARALVLGGADVTVVCWDRDGDLPEREERAGIHVQRIRLASSHGRGTSQAFLMPRIWAAYVEAGLKLQPDVVHAHDLDTLPAGWRLARKTGAALVFDAHESYPDMLGENVSPVIKWVTRRMERFLVPKADLLVTVGEKLRKHFAEMGARATEVVGNWRDPIGSDAEAAEIRQAVRVSAGVMPASVFICFIANLTSERRVEPLLEAVARVPEAQLVVGGKGSAVPAVEAAAASCPRIRYIGMVNPVDVARWTTASDAVYYGFDPTNANARFSAPNKLFEALAAGQPVITARFGEIGEIVAETGCGILVSDYTPDALEAAIRELLLPGRADELRSAARRAGARYTRRAADEALRTSYGRLLAPRGLALLPLAGKAA